MEKRVQRRTSLGYAAIFEIHFGDSLLGGDYIIHAIGKNVQVLKFGFEHLFGEYRMRMIEDASEKRVDKAGTDSISEPRGKHTLAGMIKVLAFLKIMAGN